MDWYDVLEACRTFDRDRPFRASELQRKADFESTEKIVEVRGEERTFGSSGEQRASSWCTKLVQMGLLEDMGKVPPIYDPVTKKYKYESSGRVPHLYSVTERGWKLKARPMSRLDRLLAAVGELKSATGTSEERKLYQELLAVAQEIEKELTAENKKGGRE